VVALQFLIAILIGAGAKLQKSAALLWAPLTIWGSHCATEALDLDLVAGYQ